MLTNLLSDKLIKSSPSRVINVTSNLYESGKINWQDINMNNNYNPMNSYKQSKLANVLFTLELSKRFQNSNVKVVSVSPGIVLTSLGRYHIETYGYLSYLKLILMYPLIKYAFKTPKEGAQTTIFCSTEEFDKIKSGKLYRNCKEIEVNSNGKNEEDARKLWDLSEELLNLKF